MTINVQWKFALKLTIGLQKYSVIWEQTYVKHEKSINDYRKKHISKQMAYDWVKKKHIRQAFTEITDLSSEYFPLLPAPSQLKYYAWKTETYQADILLFFSYYTVLNLIIKNTFCVLP